MIKNHMKDVTLPIGSGVGRIDYRFDIRDEYVKFIKKCVPVDLTGMRIVADCAEGAAYYTSVKALRELGAELIPIHVRPDGTNINANCGSTHMGDLKAFVKENGADIGFAFDGDADRCLAVDENGELIDGDKILAICGQDMKKRGVLVKNTIVGTVMSNLGLSLMGDAEGISILQTNVGDRYVLEKMLEEGYNLGGEQSGHVIFLDHNTTGDGALTAIQLLSVMKRSGKKASELASLMETMPQVLVNARVDNAKKNDYMNIPTVRDAIHALEEEFSKDGRVLIRTSGTEPLVRVMLEGKDIEKMEREAKKLAEFIEKMMQ